MPNDNKELINADSGLYQALMAHKIYQDSLLWSRANLLIAVQAGIFTAGFYSMDKGLGVIIMFFGALIVSCILILMHCDKNARDVNNHLLDKLARRLIPQDVIDEIDDECEQLGKPNDFSDKYLKRLRVYKTPEDGKILYVRFTYPYGKAIIFKGGRNIFQLIVYVLIASDITLGVLFWKLN